MAGLLHGEKVNCSARLCAFSSLDARVIFDTTLVHYMLTQKVLRVIFLMSCHFYGGGCVLKVSHPEFSCLEKKKNQIPIRNTIFEVRVSRITPTPFAVLDKISYVCLFNKN